MSEKNKESTQEASQEVSQAVKLPDSLNRQTVTLNETLRRGKSLINEIQIRTPSAGEMRQISMSRLLVMDVDELTNLLPRITAPTLTSQEIGQLHPSDLMQMGAKIIGFLVPEKEETTLTT